ncbi:alpha/beta hydrolase family protein [Propionibacteriaceae bacterium Y1685]
MQPRPSELPDPQAWRDALGVRPDPAASVVWQDISASEQTCALTSYGTTIAAHWLRPDGAEKGTVIIPFYEVASVLGRDSRRTRNRTADEVANRAWGSQLLARGYAVLIVPWWCEVEAALANDAAEGLAERYTAPAARHLERGVGTGLGRSLAELQQVLDACLEHGVDPRISAFGHSLGGKLSMFLGALDERIGQVITHEPGLGLAHSNWTDPWYLGDTATPADLDQLLALVAPRPTLYVGGSDSDGLHNADLAQAAIEATQEGWLDTLVHNARHTPPPHVLAACWDWLDRSAAV